MSGYTFRKAERKDIPLILSFIRKLAEYERMADLVVTDEAMLEHSIFDLGGANVVFLTAEGHEIGFALYFHNFSTFLGRRGLYLEDLFVLPEYRGRGYGKALLKELARIAYSEGCGRFEWWCLDWNRPSIDFYLSMGAVPMDEWTTYRLEGDALKHMAFGEK